MCLLSFFPPGVMPDLTALLNGTYFNDDGHGFAIVSGDQLVVRRGMDAEAMISAFDTARRQYPDGPALFHSRFGTHGHYGIDNCHPFPVAGDARTVLAHNGVLPSLVRPAKGDPRSDTRIAAEDYLGSFGSLHSRRSRMRLERWMTPHNKVVILTVDPRFTERAYILNEASGRWHDGIWYSNDGYLPPPAEALVPLYERTTWDWPSSGRTADDLGGCPVCHAVIDPAENNCPYCGWCIDCGEMPESCSCYTPAALGNRVRPMAPPWPQWTDAAQ